MGKDSRRPLKPLAVGHKIQQEALARLDRQATPAPWRNRKIVNSEHLRAYLVGLLNRCERGEVDDQRAARLANIGQILAGVIRQGEVTELAQRIRELEDKLGALG